MPKKRDGPDSKKARKSSAASKDPSASPMGNADIVPPPTPSATHLVASNPFDDTVPSNSVKVMNNFSNQPMMRMGGPAFPGWGPGPRGGIRPPYGNPGASNWSGNLHGNPNMGQMPGYTHSLPSNGFGHFHGPGMPGYRGSSRMSLNNIRPGMGHLGSSDMDGMMHESVMGPNHLVSSGNHGHMLQNTGQMKVLTRSGPQMPLSRKASTSLSKNLGSESKSPKTSDSGAKQRKKAEKKSNQENRTKSNENDRVNNNDSAVAPHSILPKEPQNCKFCNKNIDYPCEDAIRCLASCNMWYHRVCVGLTPEAYNFLKSEEVAIWACDYCLKTKEIHSVRPRMPMVDGQIASA